MKFPDRQSLRLAPEVLLESAAGEDRIVVWVPRDREWERIGTVARAEITVEDGLAFTPAFSIRAERPRGLSALASRLGVGQRDRTWQLPGGATLHQIGDRRTGLVLAWGQNGGSPVDAAFVQARWPSTEGVEPLGANLFLVSGVESRVRATAPAVPVVEDPRVLAENAVAEARAANNPRALAAALTDLGSVRLVMKAPLQASPLLEEALAINRQLGDSNGEADALVNLGSTALELGDRVRALDLYRQSLACATSAGNRFAAKLALEQLGLAHLRVGNAAGATPFLEEAVALARALGDTKHETQLRWYLGISHAESGRRDLAAAEARAAVELLERTGHPDAASYADHLRGYERGGASLAAAGQQATVASAQSLQPPSDPRWLRQALTAAEAMVKFVGSGGRTVSPDVRRRRLEVCGSCEHHTGVRCRLCGCYTRVKTRLPHEACPIGKWPADTSR